MLQISEMRQMEPEKLNDLLAKEYSILIPTSIENASDMSQAGSMLGKLTNNYVYLMSALSYFKIWVKQCKQNGNKEETELMMMRRDCVQTACDVIKQQYNAISRMITVVQEINYELRFTDGFAGNNRRV